MKTISYRAFEFSSALKTIFLNDGLETIENFAFDNCGNLLYITIPGTVTSMGKGVLAQCNLLNKVTIEEGVTAIPEDAFDRCRSLETVNLPDSLTTIGDIAFFGCTKLKTLKLPKNLQTFTDSPGRNFGGLNIALTVDPENQYFSTDDLGVLYNKDKTLLYYCPNLPYTLTTPSDVISINMHSRGAKISETLTLHITCAPYRHMLSTAAKISIP